MNRKIKEDNLERMELVAQDTKKEFHYNKHTGEWGWANRGFYEEVNWGFTTRLDALCDAVRPYLEESD